MIATYGWVYGCYPVLQECCLFRSHCRALQQATQLLPDEPGCGDLSEPSTILSNQRLSPRTASWGTQRSWLKCHSGHNHFLQTDVEADRLGHDMTWGWVQSTKHPNNPVYKTVWPTLCAAGLIGGLLPFSFVLLLWFRVARQQLNWYTVFVPLVSASFSIIWYTSIVGVSTYFRVCNNFVQIIFIELD